MNAVLAQTVSRVVVGYDGSPSAQDALDVAIEEARVRGVPLHVVHAEEVGLFLPGRDEAHDRAAQKAVQDAYARSAAVLGEHAITTHIEPGTASHVLLRQSHPGDLLVVGSHGFRPLSQLFVGSTSEAVAGHAAADVLVVRAVAQHPKGCITVGMDGSAQSKLALARALEIAARDGATVRAVLATPTIIDAFGAITGPDDEMVVEATQALAADVAEVAEGSGVTVEQYVVRSHPVDALQDNCQGARLLVVGSRGRGGVAAMVLGSVGRRLVHTAPCPVLVVHPAPDPAAA
jgi:nucleotide-binding universal stress UspA family protein